MADMPGGSSHFTGTDVWGTPYDMEPNPVMHGGGEDINMEDPVHTAVTYPAITDPAITDPTVTDPAVTDPAITDNVWATEERRQLANRGLSHRGKTPAHQRESPYQPLRGRRLQTWARAYASAVSQKAKRDKARLAREKQELEARLAKAQEEKDDMALQLALRDQAWDASKQEMQHELDRKWEYFTAQRDREFKEKFEQQQNQNLAAMKEQFKEQIEQHRNQNFDELRQRMGVELTEREQEYNRRLAEIEDNNRRELAAIEENNRREQEKRQVESHFFDRSWYLPMYQADHETNMAAFHARFSSQRQGTQGPQNNDTVEGRFPDAPPARTPQYVAQATREERRVETIIRRGHGRLPNVSMTAPTPPEGSAAREPSAVPDPDPQQSLLLDLDDPRVKKKLEGMLREMTGQPKRARKKRIMAAGAMGSLIQARKTQQNQLDGKDDLRWKKIVREAWRINTGRNRTKDFSDYQAVSEDQAKRCEAGETEPDANSYQLYFGTGYATSLWNKSIIQKAINQLLEKRAQDPGHYDVPEVSEEYLQALFANCLKEGRSEWARHQPRAGESLGEARERAEQYEVERRERNIGSSRKSHKLSVRSETTERMVKVSLARDDQPAAAAWKWLKDDVLDALDMGGMSSEEDEPVEVQCGDTRMVSTAHKIKICPWRLPKVIDYLELIDSTSDKVKTKTSPKRFRIRGETQSKTDPPLRLPRALYNTAWLEEQKTFIPDIEEQLEISEKEVTLMEIAVLE
ncbi:hypothetical protein C8R44DRAFT_745190 [Mycena epipterygia]|nr:hypothetical protein C8R44DRAFT_745190 [Mycena epipterygia]